MMASGLKPELRDAVVSDDGVYRYALSRQWDESLPVLAFGLLNPSTADALEDDPTVRRMRGFARVLGYGAFVVWNAYAYRATHPRELREAGARGVDIVGPGNDAVIRSLVSVSDLCILGWGTKCEPSRAHALLDLLRSCRYRDGSIVVPKALRLTKSGCPEHPLYLPGDLTPIDVP